MEHLYRILDFVYEIEWDSTSVGVYEPLLGTSLFDGAWDL
jgi:hypothetical protein